MTDEVRVTSATGGEKGQKEARFGGGDPLAMMELARVYGFGEQKYDRYNYLKGYAFSLSVDALFRHLFAFLAGEDRDPESGLLHTAHVAWHGQTLTSFLLRGVGEDDRPPVLADNVSPRTIGEARAILDALNLTPPTVNLTPPRKVVVSEAWGTGDGEPVEFHGMPLKEWNAIGVSPLSRSRDLQRCFACGHMGVNHSDVDLRALGACYDCPCTMFYAP